MTKPTVVVDGQKAVVRGVDQPGGGILYTTGQTAAGKLLEEAQKAVEAREAKAKITTKATRTPPADALFTVPGIEVQLGLPISGIPTSQALAVPTIALKRFIGLVQRCKTIDKYARYQGAEDDHVAIRIDLLNGLDHDLDLLEGAVPGIRY